MLSLIWRIKGTPNKMLGESRGGEGGEREAGGVRERARGKQSRLRIREECVAAACDGLRQSHLNLSYKIRFKVTGIITETPGDVGGIEEEEEGVVEYIDKTEI